MTEPVIRNVSDTARWVATYRARETERPNALFRDPYASRLADARGERIAAATPNVARSDWPFIVRTYLFDRFITEEVKRGVDTVLNLAAGLDARPYRMALPSSLTWIEVDLPEILDYKRDVLAADTPACSLERVALDLSNAAERRAFFRRVSTDASRTLIVAEGLLIYLPEAEVAALSRELAETPRFERWIVDIASPGLVRMMQQRMGDVLTTGGASFQFAPAEGPAFFERYGWTAIDVESLFETAARVKRLPWTLRLLMRLPQPKGPNRIWSGVCRLEPSRRAGTDWTRQDASGTVIRESTP